MSSPTQYWTRWSSRSAHALGAAGLCAAFFASSATAQERLGGSIGITNDYRVRGVSLTLDEPAIQGGAHQRFSSGWFVGAWGSTLDRNPGPSPSVEIDAYLGFTWTFARDWDAKLALTHYWYPDDPAQRSYDYDELAASIGYRAQLVATIAWSPNSTHFGRYQQHWQAERGRSMSYELTGLHPLTDAFALTAGIGYNDLSRLFDTGYWYWNIGATYAIGPLRLDIAHIDSDDTAEDLFGAARTQAGWSAAISWHF